MFDESKHPRDEIGRFVEKTSDGIGGEHIATPAEEKRMRETGIKLQLDRREYAILRAEVIRKNAAQKGKVKSTNFAFTTDYFYVYTTDGYDGFSPFVQLDIEKDSARIADIIGRLD